MEIPPLTFAHYNKPMPTRSNPIALHCAGLALEGRAKPEQACQLFWQEWSYWG
jgi:hypothetical protein